MKKTLILILLIFFCSGSAFGDVFEDALKKAKQGDAFAQFNIGMLYMTGTYSPPNYQQAFYWLKKSAEQEYALAQYYLGLMYYTGKEVPQNYRQAFYWFNKSAEQGNASAQYLLGIMYYTGKGVPQNYKQAYIWTSLAAAQEHEKAAVKRSSAARKLSPQQLSEAQELTAKMYKIYSPKNDDLFENTLKKAKQGDAKAQCELAWIYVSGKIMPQNNKQSFYWYKKSAEQGYDRAQFYLGVTYRDNQDYKQAYIWTSLAAAQGYKNAAIVRNNFSEKLTPQQLAEAQELAAQMQEKIDSAKK